MSRPKGHRPRCACFACAAIRKKRRAGRERGGQQRIVVYEETIEQALQKQSQAVLDLEQLARVQDDRAARLRLVEHPVRFLWAVSAGAGLSVLAFGGSVSVVLGAIGSVLCIGLAVVMTALCRAKARALAEAARLRESAVECADRVIQFERDLLLARVAAVSDPAASPS